ncbi:MAG: SCO family protein [Desulfuromonadales bacterium]|nr:SCO family protein [Desulfuromonadales bacterium]
MTVNTTRKFKGNRPFCARAGTLTLAALLGLLLLCSSSWAQQPHQGMGETQHSMHDKGHGTHDMEQGASHAAEQEAQPAGDHGAMHGDMHDQGHAAPTKPSTHIHPSPETAASDEVGLDEKLGSFIPLNLTFRDETGQPITLADLVTKPTIIAPVYYRCPNVCHFLQGDLARVLPGLKLEAGVDYQVISFSFDDKEQPELAARSRDTYYAAMQGDYPQQAWRFLTGDAASIKALTEAVGYRFKRVKADFLHPVAFFVVSPQGKIVRYLHGTHVLPKDLTLALYEAKEGRVGATIRKVVQFCFSFDPQQKTYVFNILRVSATVILITLGSFLAFLLLAGKKKKKGDKS